MLELLVQLKFVQDFQLLSLFNWKGIVLVLSRIIHGTEVCYLNMVSCHSQVYQFRFTADLIFFVFGNNLN